MIREVLRRRVMDRLDPHMREVVEGAAVALGMRMFAAVLGLLLNIVLARALGPERTGIYFLALSLVTVTATLSRLGLDSVILRFTAAGAAVRKWAEVGGVYRKSIGFAAVASILTAGLLGGASGWMARVIFAEPALTWPLRVMALAVPFVAMVNLHGRALQGVKRILFAQAANGVALPLFALPAVWILAPTFGATGAAAAYVLAAGIAAGLGLLLWRRATPDLRRVEGRFSTGTLFRSAFPLLAVAALNLVIEWSSTLFLGALSTPESVGIYNVAHRTAFLVALALAAVNSIAAPKFAELYRKGEMAALGATARNSTRMILLVALPALVVLFTFPGTVMGLFGAEFVQGATVLRVIALGHFVNVVTGSVGYLLIMCGEERLYRSSAIFAAAVNLALNALLVPRFAALGAAIATAATLTILHLTAALLVWRRLRIQPLPLRLRER